MVIVCEQGYASSLAAETLQRIGLTEATDLDGGFEEWLKWDGLRLIEP
jgi:rhodanese-related sulfurtransferase